MPKREWTLWYLLCAAVVTVGLVKVGPRVVRRLLRPTPVRHVDYESLPPMSEESRTPVRPADTPRGFKEAKQPVMARLTAARDRVLRSAGFRNPGDGTPLRLEKVRCETEVYLELLYLYELERYNRRHQEGESATGAGADSLDRRIEAASSKLTLPGDQRPFQTGARLAVEGEENGTNEGYTQWFALLIYALRGRTSEWAENGPADRRIEDLIQTTEVWGYDKPGRYRVSGSNVTTAMSVLLTLYLNPEWVSGEVGLRLGAPGETLPRGNEKAPERRVLFRLLGKCCEFVESCYPGQPVPATTGMRYHVNYPLSERQSLIGGKILYFLSKSVIAYESNDPEGRKKNLESCLRIIHQLQDQLGRQARGTLPPEMHPIKDSYELANTFRGLTILTRLYSRDPDGLGYTIVLADLIETLVENADAGMVEERYCGYYLPLAKLQVLNELDEAIDWMERK